MGRMGGMEWLSWIFPVWELEGVATVPSQGVAEVSLA